MSGYVEALTVIGIGNAFVCYALGGLRMKSGKRNLLRCLGDVALMMLLVSAAVVIAVRYPQA